MTPGGATFVVAHNGAAIFGGAERWTVRLLAGLQSRGHRVLLLCRDERIAAEARRKGVDARVARLRGHVVLPDAWRLALLLRELRPDALLLSTFKKTWLGGMGARLAGVPRVVARIGLSSDRPARRFVYRIALTRFVDRVVANSDEIRAAVLEDLPGLDRRRVVTVYNGVEAPPRRREPGALRRELDLAPDVPVLGTVARLATQKRLDRLLRVVAELPPRAVCLVAGDGPERGALRELARELGLGERVRFLGHRDDVGDVLAALDVYVVTSDREGMSNSMLEALAAGVPVISTPVSGTAAALEPLPDGQHPGRVVSADVPSLARAVGELLADPVACRAMGAAARERAHTRFDRKEELDRWERLLTRDVMADVGEQRAAAPAPADPLR